MEVPSQFFTCLVLLYYVHLNVAAPASSQGRGLGLGREGELKMKARGFNYIKKYFDVVPLQKGQPVPANVTLQRGITELQEMGGLEPTGVLDEPTVRLISRPRCGVPDKVVVDLDKDDAAPLRAKRYNAAGGNYKWFKNDLTYKLENYPDFDRSIIDVEEVDAAITEAFKLWSDATPLTFTRVAENEPADLVLVFGAGYHTTVNGDPPFDGPGGTLAHAFTPNSGWGSLNGDVHFDDAEQYTHEKYFGTNLLYTAAHEIGHALGLDHSNVQGALMWPWAKGYTPDFRLPIDDVQGIQSIYGPNPNPPPTQPPVVTTPGIVTTPMPDEPYCHLMFDDVAVIRGEIYAFKSNMFWRFSADGHWIGPEAGITIPKFFINAPSKVNSVFERWYDGKIVMIKGTKLYEFDTTVLNENFPQHISKLGMRKGINAAMHRASTFTTYYFKGLRVYEFDEATQTLKYKRPRKASRVFPGLPEDSRVTAAFTAYDGKSYLIVGSDYFEVESDLSIAKPARSFAVDFFHCPEKR